MRLPGLAGDDTAITNGLLVYKCTSSLLCFESEVFIAGNALAFREVGSGEYLNAMGGGPVPPITAGIQ